MKHTAQLDHTGWIRDGSWRSPANGRTRIVTMAKTHPLWEGVYKTIHSRYVRDSHSAICQLILNKAFNRQLIAVATYRLRYLTTQLWVLSNPHLKWLSICLFSGIFKQFDK